MQELIDAIKAWPVIVQGALGSALFWLILLCGQFVTIRISGFYSHHSKKARLSWLVSLRNKYLGASTNNENEETRCAVMLIYRSSRYLFKSLMWLVMGFIFQELFSPIGIVGFCGSLYYLFKAYEIVSPIKDDVDSAAELIKVDKEIEELDNA